MNKKFVFLGKVILAVMLVLAFVGCPDPGGNIGNVNKEAGATVAAPSGTTYIIHNRIVIIGVPAPGNGQTIEYAINTENSAPSTGWQDITVFSELTPETTYFIFARTKENSTYYAGDASAGFIVNTNIENPFIVSAVSAGQTNSLVIKEDGSLWQWGSYASSTFAWGEINFPTRIGLDNDWAYISAGAGFNLAIKINGSLWAWGRNSNGQLDDETTTNRSTPTRIGLDNDWAYISAGRNHSIAIKKDGSLWVWGNNEYGQLGDGTLDPRYSPVRIGIENNWSVASAGSDHSLAIKTDGSLWAWGRNNTYQLGLYDQGYTTNTNRNTPIQIGTDISWSFVYAGDQYSHALKQDGSRWFWGSHGGAIFPNILNHTPGDTSWVSISAGDVHSLAIKEDGGIWASGNNYYYALGDDILSSYTTRTPFRIGIDSDWLNISAGRSHNLAIKTDGSLWAWGSGGLVGDGTNTRRNTPVQIFLP